MVRRKMGLAVSDGAHDRQWASLRRFIHEGHARPDHRGASASAGNWGDPNKQRVMALMSGTGVPDLLG
jgi:hypothetical protein